MSSNRNLIETPAPQPGLALTPEVQGLLGSAASAAIGEYFTLKMVQPDWRQLLFTETTGPTITSTYGGYYTPRSIVVYNPTSQPVFVSTGGVNPLALGIAIEPQSISPRLPILASDVTVGLDPANVDLTATEYLVHLFRYWTP